MAEPETTDTDMLLAILASILDDHTVDRSKLLDTLVSHDGDVAAAAAALNTRPMKRRASFASSQPGKKKRGLEQWLAPKASSSARAPSSESTLPLDAHSPIRMPARLTARVASLPGKPAVNLMNILRAPTSTTSTPERLPPLMLATPALVAANVPCTLHPSVLPPELASLLFHTMIDEAHAWNRNQMWLFDRFVTSPHRTAFYTRQSLEGSESMANAAQSWYRGRPTETSLPFPPAMEQACAIIEDVVNAELRKRKREPLEWDDDTPDAKVWIANVAGANCYEGAKETVGLHTDSLTRLGPYPTIASLSLGTSRTFRLREIIPAEEEAHRHARTFNIPLHHNALVIMHAGTQERYKHSVPPQSVLDMFTPRYPHPSGTPAMPSNCRINITFRFFRPDFASASIPNCACGVPAVLRPDAKRRAKPGREEDGFRYWWCCDSKAKDGGKDCGFWKVMDVDAEGRGPLVRDRETRANARGTRTSGRAPDPHNS